MAVIVLGKTTCGICGKPLLKGEAITNFSPFVMNEADPLHFFSDRAFHERCFAGAPRAAEVRERFNELRARTAPGARKCAVCGQEIRDPDDYLSFAYIATEPRDVRPAVSSSAPAAMGGLACGTQGAPRTRSFGGLDGVRTAVAHSGARDGAEERGVVIVLFRSPGDGEKGTRRCGWQTLCRCISCD
jgi:hypothetical protein